MGQWFVECFQGWKDSLFRIRLLTGKNCVILHRNPIFLFFAVFTAAIFLTVIFFSLGGEPHFVPFGLINPEIDNLNMCFNDSRVPNICNVENLSCSILSYLSPRTFQWELLNNEDDAIKEVEKGNIWGYTMFPPNFSTTLYERYTRGLAVNETTSFECQIILRLDESNKQVTDTLKEKLSDAFEDFHRGFLTKCGVDPRQANQGLMYGAPMFGRKDTTFGKFIAGGAAPSLIFFFPIITTSIRFIREKKSGMLDRSLVAGVQMWEIMVAFSISEFFVLFCQCLLNYAVIRFILQIEILGSHFLLLLLFLLSGFGGVSMGLLLGAVCTTEVQTAVIAMATFLPNFILSGVVWPVEGMWIGLQYFVQILPGMKAGEAARSIISRGWEFTHPSVWPGFVLMTAYIFGFFLLCVLHHTMRKK